MKGVGNEGRRIGKVADDDLDEKEEKGETQHRQESTLGIAEDSHFGRGMMCEVAVLATRTNPIQFNSRRRRFGHVQVMMTMAMHNKSNCKLTMTRAEKCL